jgi:hypothetical protein
MTLLSMLPFIVPLGIALLALDFVYAQDIALFAKMELVIYRKVKGKITRFIFAPEVDKLGRVGYCKMYYIIMLSLAGTKLPHVVLSYDIGCQWSRNLSCHMKDLPEDLQLNPDVKVKVGIPTLHTNGHSKECKTAFSLSYMPRIG